MTALDAHPAQWDEYDADGINIDEEPPVLDGIEDAVRLMHRRHKVQRHAADLERARQARQALIDQEQAGLDAWTADVMSGVERALDWLDQALTSYLRAEHARDPRVLSIDLAGLGKVKSTKQGPAWEYPDPAAFVAWAEANGRTDLVRTPPPPAAQPDKKALKDVLRPADGKPGDTVPVLAPVGTVDELDEDTGELVERIVWEEVPGLSVTIREPRKYEVKAEGGDL